MKSTESNVNEISQQSMLLPSQDNIPHNIATTKNYSSIRSILKKKSNWPNISQERGDEEESSTSSTLFSSSASSIQHGSRSSIVDAYDGTWEDESNGHPSFCILETRNGRKEISADTVEGFDASSTKMRRGDLPAHMVANSRSHRSTRFDLDDIQVIYVPKCSAEDWSLLYYDDDEIGEFRYQKFLEEIQQDLNE